MKFYVFIAAENYETGRMNKILVGKYSDRATAVMVLYREANMGQRVHIEDRAD